MDGEARHREGLSLARVVADEDSHAATCSRLDCCTISCSSPSPWKKNSQQSSEPSSGGSFQVCLQVASMMRVCSSMALAMNTIWAEERNQRSPTLTFHSGLILPECAPACCA